MKKSLVELRPGFPGACASVGWLGGRPEPPCTKEE
jgi:hypothetical protein